MIWLHHFLFRISLFWLILNHHMVHSLSCNSSEPICHNDERLALLNLYKSFTMAGATSYGSKTMPWYGNTTDCCQWNGVTCDLVTGHVIFLELQYLPLRGIIEHNSSLYQLSHLRKLDLSGNFNLEMPSLETLTANLTALEYIDLSVVSINSAPTPSLGNLTSLVHLDLSNCGLRGKFPSIILNLPHLQFLNFGGNNELSIELESWSSPLSSLNLAFTNFSSLLPRSINQSEPLQQLILYGTGVFGPVPTWLWNVTQVIEVTSNHLTGNLALVVNTAKLSSLTDLYLGGNQLSGSIPSWPFQLPSLRSLSLDANKFSGPLSDISSNFSNSLETIKLGDNNISGSIPSSLFNLLHLTYLDLSYNYFSGTVDLNMFSRFQSLNFMSLSGNSLSVFLSSSNESNSSYTWSQLEHIGLSSCNISEFPYFGAQDHLTELDLSNNNIQGEIPKWMINVNQAGYDESLGLNLSHNLFTGGLLHLPWMKLGIIDISFNRVQGPLPIFPASLELVALYASDNILNGTIDQSICHLVNLVLLDLSNNSLVGDIPQCLGNTSTQLAVLNLQANGLKGLLPPKFLKCDSLSYLDLSNNQLEGVVPESLSQCKRLQVLNLGNNNFMDTFPLWLDSIPKLQVLSLSSNRFYGTVTSPDLENHSFPELQVIDISNNNFTGLLPMRYVSSFRAMMKVKAPPGSPHYLGYDKFLQYSYSISLTFNGQILKYTKIITTLSTFDLSNNRFEGEIPDSTGKLVSLRGLNLSHNHLRGSIPPSLGNLSLLDCLDLSSNKLTGGIPRELAHLTFLGVFNVSENQLAGHIPSGKPFDTFSADSFEGNPGLCGPPLPECGSKRSPPTNLDHIDNGDDLKDGRSIFLEWETIMMGFGCGMLVGLAWGYCMLLIGKPFWFIRLANALELALLHFFRNLFRRSGR